MASVKTRISELAGQLDLLTSTVESEKKRRRVQEVDLLSVESPLLSEPSSIRRSVIARRRDSTRARGSASAGTPLARTWDKCPGCSARIRAEEYYNA